MTIVLLLYCSSPRDWDHHTHRHPVQFALPQEPEASEVHTLAHMAASSNDAFVSLTTQSSAATDGVLY